MESYITWFPWIALVPLWILYHYLKEREKTTHYRFPPQVPGPPFFGNTFQVPIWQQGGWAKSLAEKYGEMYTCRIGSNTWVFLNSSRVVEDLLERRSAIYSSRAEAPMVSDILSGGKRMVLMPYGERWRIVRKYAHQVLNTRTKNPFKEFQELESTQLLHEYSHTPDRWFEANQRFANAVIMSVVFGRRAQLDDPVTKKLFESSGEFLENLQAGHNLVDGFTQLARLPKFLQWWRPRGERGYNKTLDIYREEVDRLRQRITAGTATPCFGVDFLAATEKSELEESQKLFTLGTLMEAGSDTSRITTSQVVAAAATYPDWVQRAREQLDAVCGANADRLPVFDDRPQLPYITAATKESFRWRPMAEIGVPHALIRDDEYEGYKFPAGTVFTWNAYAIALDAKEYDQPERFWPERFLNEDLNNPLKGHWGFGAGRRVCAGYQVGENNVWIALARLVYCFDFIEDPNRPIDTLSAPWQVHDKAPFHVEVRPRSPQHAALIERSFKEAIAGLGPA
ncbi:hypothetical protein MBLNU459_g0292t1 [Dothideomycetes sp. NU459]